MCFLQQLRVEAIAQLQVVQAQERAVFHKTVADERVVVGRVLCTAIQGTWDGSDVTFLTSAVIDGLALVVIARHSFHIQACHVQDVTFYTIGELRIQRKAVVMEFEAETARELWQ